MKICKICTKKEKKMRLIRFLVEISLITFEEEHLMTQIKLMTSIFKQELR